MSAHPFHKLFELRGHTHNLVDQRFAVVGQVLKRSPVLENLEDFAAAVREDVTPKAGRDLRVEVMEGSHDWASFFAPINTAISGLVSTKLEPEACHAWRMIRREDMNTYTGSARWEIEVPEDCGPYSPLLQSLLRPSPSRHRYCNLGRWTPADPANPRESPPSHARGWGGRGGQGLQVQDLCLRGPWPPTTLDGQRAFTDRTNQFRFGSGLPAFTGPTAGSVKGLPLESRKWPDAP